MWNTDVFILFPAPGAIVGLSFQSINPPSFQANWEPPSSPCPAETYTIEYILTNRDQCEPISDAPRSYRSTVTDTTATNDELIPYSTYVVFVWATNTYGNGPETTMNVTTQAWGGKYEY